MTESTSSTAPTAADVAVGRLANRGLLLGGVGLAGGLLFGLFGEGGLQRFMASYVIAYAFVLSVALGGLGFTILQHLCRVGWSVTNRRIAELLAGTMPLLAVLFVPIALDTLLSSHPVFPWADENLVAHDALIQKKAAWLNPSAFLVRWVIFLAIWNLLSRFFLANSVEQDRSGDPLLTLKMERWSAPSLLLFAITLTFAAFDLLMSLDPHWFSTIFGVYYFAGAMSTFFATCILLGTWLQKNGAIGENEITNEHRHDLGKFQFGFVVFWSYIAFSQFMLIWYANIPEETGWYQIRQEGPWAYLSLGLIFLHFVIPFLGLLSRHIKRRRELITFWAGWMVFAQWYDLTWLAIPSVQHFMGHGHEGAAGEALEHAHAAFPLGLGDPLTTLGLAGLTLFFFARRARGLSLTPKMDPRRSESLAFENL